MLICDFAIQVRYRHCLKDVFQFRLGTDTYVRCHSIGTYNYDTIFQTCISIRERSTWQSIFQNTEQFKVFLSTKGGGWVCLALSRKIHYFFAPFRNFPLNFLHDSTYSCFLLSRVTLIVSWIQCFLQNVCQIFISNQGCDLRSLTFHLILLLFRTLCMLISIIACLQTMINQTQTCTWYWVFSIPQ